MTDAERLDWLEAKTHEGGCPAVINDDNGHWAVAFDGVQSVAWGDDPVDVQTCFFIEKDSWRNSIREAIDSAMNADAVD